MLSPFDYNKYGNIKVANTIRKSPSNRIHRRTNSIDIMNRTDLSTLN